MNKSERLIKLLLLLHKSSHYTPKILFSILGCSERQVYRDINSLSQIGISVFFDRDGYKLHSKEYFACLDLTAEENIVLRLGLASSAITKHPKLAEAAAELFDKFKLSDNKSFLGREDGAITIVTTAKQDLHFNLQIHTLLTNAILQCSIVQLSYHALTQTSPEKRKVSPYLLLYRREHWYLIGWCHDVNEIGLFRVDRIKSCNITNEHFDSPLEFDPVKYFENAWEMFPGNTPTKIVVEFSPKVARIVTETRRHHSQTTEELPNGSVLWEVVVNGDLRELKWWLMSFGGEIKVLEPQSLIDDIQKTAQEILNRYL